MPFPMRSTHPTGLRGASARARDQDQVIEISQYRLPEAANHRTRNDNQDPRAPAELRRKCGQMSFIRVLLRSESGKFSVALQPAPASEMGIDDT
jgi:hypothetical protein